MNVTDRMHVYRGWVELLACAIYNDEGWDKQSVARLLHMGDPSLEYNFRNPPERLTPDDVYEAMDRVFERGGI